MFLPSLLHEKAFSK